MKRVLSMLLALILLLTCFSGMVVSATEADNTEVVVAPEVTEESAEETPEAAAEEAESGLVEAPMETVEWFSSEKKRSSEPAVYGAAYEHEVPTAFMNYLNQQFAACKTEFDVSSYNIPHSQWESLKAVIWYETPELFHVKSLGCSYYTGGKIATIRAGYRTHSDTASEYKTCLNKMTTNAEVLLRGIKGNNNLSNVQKALLLHDRLAVFVEYDLGNVDTAGVDHKIFAAYSALGEGLSVCQGYALAYMYLLEQVGIESDLCQSDALWHAWNIVYINNKPYHVDVTWDDPTNSRSYTYYDDLGRVRHVNFLRSTAGIRQTGHTAYDYITTPTDTYYDEDCWWMDTNTSIELIGNALYHLDYNNGKIYKLDDSDWSVVYQGSNYSESKLAKVGTKLLLSEQRSVLLVDPATGAATTVFSPSYAQYSGAYIEGMKYENGKITCQVYWNGTSYYQSLNYVDEGAKVTITKQPKNAVAGNGKTVTTTVEASGDGLSYKWYFRNAGAADYSLSSITTNTYSTAMNAAKNGCQVYCVITDIYGNSVTSDVATLYMGNMATITAQPQNAVAPLNTTVKTTIKATGDGLTYTWYFKNVTEEDWSLSSNTTATYTATMYDTTNGCQVYCVVTDQYGNSVTSNVVTLYIGNTLKITTQPKNIVAPNGKTATLTVKASGDGLTYTWYYMKSGASGYTKSGNQTTNTLSVKMSKDWNGAKFYCVVTDQYGNSVKTSVVTMKLAPATTITTQPGNAAAPKGKTAKVTLKASGDGLKYTWYVMKKGASKYTKDTSMKSNYFSVKMSSSWDGAKVYCVVSDQYGNTAKSNVATLYMGTPVKITTQPKNTAMAEGRTLKLTLKASGKSLKYTWYYMKKGATKYTKDTSQKSGTFSVKMSASWGDAKVYCVVTDKYGVAVKSSVVTLKKAAAAKITQQPVGATVVKNAKAKVTVKATGDGLKYQWYYAKKGSSKFKKVSSAKTATYSLKMTSSTDGRKVYCVVTDKYGVSVKSKTVTLKTFDAVKTVSGSWKGVHQEWPDGYKQSISKITIQITSKGKVTLKAPASGTGYNGGTYKYTLKFVKLSGDTATYRFTNKTETLSVTYSLSKDQLNIHLGSGYTQVYKPK